MDLMSSHVLDVECRLVAIRFSAIECRGRMCAVGSQLRGEVSRIYCMKVPLRSLAWVVAVVFVVGLGTWFQLSQSQLALTHSKLAKEEVARQAAESNARDLQSKMLKEQAARQAVDVELKQLRMEFKWEKIVLEQKDRAIKDLEDQHKTADSKARQMQSTLECNKWVITLLSGAVLVAAHYVWKQPPPPPCWKL